MFVWWRIDTTLKRQTKIDTSNWELCYSLIKELVGELTGYRSYVRGCFEDSHIGEFCVVGE